MGVRENFVSVGHPNTNGEKHLLGWIAFEKGQLSALG